MVTLLSPSTSANIKLCCSPHHTHTVSANREVRPRVISVSKYVSPSDLTILFASLYFTIFTHESVFVYMGGKLAQVYILLVSIMSKFARNLHPDC